MNSRWPYLQIIAYSVGYVPTLVATQVVAGTNYRFTATATPVYPNAESYKVYVYVYKPLQGVAQLIEIVRDWYRENNIKSNGGYFIVPTIADLNKSA